MALLHATPLGNGATSSGAFSTIYTVPAGMRVIVRSVIMRNASAGAGAGWVGVAGFTVLAYPLTGAGTAGCNFEWRPWLVLGPGSTLQIATGSGISVGFWASGSIYSI